MAHVNVIVLTWSIDLTSPEGLEIARRVRDELIPLLRQQSGFISYQGFVDAERERTSVAISTWDSAEQAQAGSQLTAEWTAEHAGSFLASRDVYGGDTILSS